MLTAIRYIATSFLCLLITLGSAGASFYASQCLHSNSVQLSLVAESEPCCEATCCTHDALSNGVRFAFADLCCTTIVVQLCVDNFEAAKSHTMPVLALPATIPNLTATCADGNAASANFAPIYHFEKCANAASVLRQCGQLRL
ncbi:MAG: hypothetical protein LBS94_04385 [Prevotellaceae bacterium]|nr:hypothetical protein [Prevotellaceae bacterium]